MGNVYALFGDPIEKSVSPQIHQHFAKQCGVSLVYRKITANKENFADVWEQFVIEGGNGANVTIPCKEKAYALCTTLSARAQRSKSVNTVRVENKTQCYGDTTDGVGFIRDIMDYYHHDLIEKNILILGAGGAAAAILPAIIEQQAKSITVANRTLSRAQALVSSYSDVMACDFFSITKTFDVVINAAADLPLTSLPNVFSSHAIAYDLRYGERAKDFMQWASNNGAHFVYDGYGMLLEQAAESFFVWFAIKPSTHELRLLFYR